MAGAWAQKTFAHPILLSHEGEPVGSGFRVPENPSKAAEPREARDSPAPHGSMESGGKWLKTACVDFLRRGRVRFWFAAGREFPFAECNSMKFVLGLRCDGASALNGRPGSGGMAGAWAKMAFARQILLPEEGEPMGSVIRVPETRSKAAGTRDPGAAQLSFALWRAEGQGRKGMALLS